MGFRGPMKKINIYKVILFIFNCFICCLLWIFLFNPILSSLINRDEIYMPDLIGDYKSDALKKLKSKGFNVEVKDIPYREGFVPFTVHDVYPRAYTKVKKGEKVSQQEVNNLLKNISSLDDKKTKERVNFIQNSGEVLEPTQQFKLLMFNPQMKEQVQKDIIKRYRPSPGGKKRFNKRF